MELRKAPKAILMKIQIEYTLLTCSEPESSQRSRIPSSCSCWPAGTASSIRFSSLNPTLWKAEIYHFGAPAIFLGREKQSIKSVKNRNLHHQKLCEKFFVCGQNYMGRSSIWWKMTFSLPNSCNPNTVFVGSVFGHCNGKSIIWWLLFDP